MLTAPYRWLDNPETCYLCFNYQTVAVLQLIEGGKVSGRLHWQAKSFYFRAGSFQQGKDWVERWVAARGNDLATRPTRPRQRMRDKLGLLSLAGCTGPNAVRRCRA